MLNRIRERCKNGPTDHKLGKAVNCEMLRQTIGARKRYSCEFLYYVVFYIAVIKRGTL